MKSKSAIYIAILMIALLCSCEEKEKSSSTNIILLHHSTGGYIWNGKPPSFAKKVVSKISKSLGERIGEGRALLPSLFGKYNKNNQMDYAISEMEFPKPTPYGWNNFPFDYYNIWIKNAGADTFMEEPTLEILTKDYQVIIFKHCFPVSNIQNEQDSVDINSDIKTIPNYQVQYNALREKLHSFPDTKFILFTGAVQVQSFITEDEAKRAKEFFTWVKNNWDLPEDNIYLWDLYNLQTDGTLYFKEEFAVSPTDSHPNKKFASRAGKLLFNRIIDVIENDGRNTRLTGEKK